MFMGSLLIVSGCFLYCLLKPPIPLNSIFQEEVIIPKHATLER